MRGPAKTPRGKVAIAVEHMKQQPEGATFSPKEMAEIMDVNIKAVHTHLRAAVKNEWIYAWGNENRRLVYSLQPKPEEEGEAEAEGEDEPTDFHATRHVDGDIDLYGLQELESGGFRLSAEAATKLRALMGPLS